MSNNAYLPFSGEDEDNSLPASPAYNNNNISLPPVAARAVSNASNVSNRDSNYANFVGEHDEMKEIFSQPSISFTPGRGTNGENPLRVRDSRGPVGRRSGEERKVDRLLSSQTPNFDRRESALRQNRRRSDKNDGIFVDDDDDVPDNFVQLPMVHSLSQNFPPLLRTGMAWWRQRVPDEHGFVSFRSITEALLTTFKSLNFTFEEIHRIVKHIVDSAIHRDNVINESEWKRFLFAFGPFELCLIKAQALFSSDG